MTSLYHTLMAAMGRGVNAVPGAGSVLFDIAKSELSAVYNPLGVFNYFECGMFAESIEGIEDELHRRAMAVAQKLILSMRVAETVFADELWPSHQRRLHEFVLMVATALNRLPDNPIVAVAERLCCTEIRESFPVTAVAMTGSGVGGYSHPTTVAVCDDPCEAIEVIIHEIVHVIAKDNETNDSSVYGILRNQCKSLERARQLFHLLQFHCCGEVVRQLMDTSYIPYAERKGLFRMMALRGVEVSSELRIALWSARSPATTHDVLAAIIDEDLTRLNRGHD